MSKKTFKKLIKLPAGNVLELDCTQEFLDKIQLHLNLEHPPTDDDIRLFIYGSVKTAVDKAEK